MNEKIKYEYVKSMKLAALLMLQGFRILGVQKDKHNPRFDVYCFRQTEELTKAILSFANKKNGGKNYGSNIPASCKNETVRN